MLYIATSLLRTRYILRTEGGESMFCRNVGNSYADLHGVTFEKSVIFFIILFNLW
jgi:hypothetical protein